MINIQHITQQVELTFWSVAIESMSAARVVSRKFFLSNGTRQINKESVWMTLAASGLGGTLGFLIGLILL